MAKRSVCMLLAIVALFSLSVPAFAEEEPIATEAPVEVTEVPVEVTEVPVEVTEVPVEATEVPVEAAEEPVIAEIADPVEEPEAAALEDEPMTVAAATSGNCGDNGDNVKWSLSGGTLTISGTGKMKDYYCGTNVNGDRPPWYSEDDPLRSTVKKVVIKPGVISIGKGAFFGCSSMTSVTIPDGVTSIGDQAFWTCAALTSVTFPGSLTTIGDGAFLSCSLTSLTIPDSVTTIGNSAFDGCNFTSLTIPESVTSIGDSVFQHCSNLTSVTIPDSVTSIGSWAFQYDTSLTSVTIPSSVTSIRDQAFVGCTSLKSLTIKNPACKLGANFTLGSGIIYGYDGSTAEAFAKENGYSFETLGPAPAPAKPSTLAAPKLSKVENVATGVKISWEAVSGAVKYRVFYKGGGKTGWTKLKDTADTSYTWTKAKSGTKYTFTVRCVSEDGESYTSAYDKTGKSVTYVAAPTVKIAKAAGGIKVTWSKVKGASRYTVYYKEGSGGWHKIGTTKDASTSYTWKKAASGKTYTLTVRAADAKKNLLSAYKASNTLKYVAAPTVKIAKAADGIKVTWNKVAGASRYTVYYKVGNGGWKKIGTTPDAATSYTWKKAQNSKTYTFTVRAADANKKLLSAFKASNSLKYTVLPKDGDRDVFEGTLKKYTYDQAKAMLGALDSRPSQNVTYWIIVLDKPQKLKLMEAAGPLIPTSVEVSMIYVRNPSSLTAYAGKHAIFSMDPYKTSMPSDTSSPLGIPRTLDVRVLG